MCLVVIPWYKTAWKWICGVDKPLEGEVELPEEEQKAKEAREKELLSTEEKPLWKNFLNINAVALCFFAIFVTGFFA